jgi:hypothetical protein
MFIFMGVVTLCGTTGTRVLDAGGKCDVGCGSCGGPARDLRQPGIEINPRNYAPAMRLTCWPPARYNPPQERPSAGGSDAARPPEHHHANRLAIAGRQRPPDGASTVVTCRGYCPVLGFHLLLGDLETRHKTMIAAFSGKAMTVNRCRHPGIDHPDNKIGNTPTFSLQRRTPSLIVSQAIPRWPRKPP